MIEIWLRPNRRALAFSLVVPLFPAVIGVGLVLAKRTAFVSWTQWLGAAMILLGAGGVSLILWQLRRPRIAYRDGQILFNLRSGPPIAVPVEIVEAFFLGQGPSHLPSELAGNEKTVNLVARLSQRETDWAARDIKPAFGEWKEGYVTIRGTWCEPLNHEVIRRLNRRLKEVKSLTESSAADAPVS